MKENPVIPEPRSRVAIRIGFALVLFTSAALPAPATAREIESILSRLAQSVAAKRVDDVMALYALPDTMAMHRERIEYEGYSGFDSLSCSAHAGPVTVRGDEMEAGIYREITYREHDRLQADGEWLSWKLRRSNGGWRIVAEETRDFARTRFTTLHVKLEPDSGRMDATANLRIRVDIRGEDNVVLHLNRGLSVLTVQDRAGRALPFRRVADVLVLPRPAPFRAGDSLTVSLAYRGALFNESKEQSYSQVSIAPEGSFASWVTSWYPRLDGPKGKSPGRITFDVPAGVTVAATGTLVSHRTAGSRQTQEFLSRAPRSFSFAAAPYAHREEMVDGVRVGVYFLTGGEAKADRYIQETGKVLQVLRKYYGMYPYDSFGIVEIPRSAALSLGGSSEQGMSLFPTGILPDDSYPLPLIAHEMGHSWWGNFIDSDEAIVAEGLAQESAVLAVQALKGEKTMRQFLHYGFAAYPQGAQQYFQVFASPKGKDLPIGIDRPGSSDRGTLHDLAVMKGHFVYDMLRASIGDSAFAGGLRQMLRSHPDTRVTLGDLRKAWERASGKELGRFFVDWFYRAGAPEFSIQESVVAEGGRFTVRGRISQLRDLYRADAEVVALLGDRVQVERVPVSERDTPFEFSVPENPKAVLFDPDYRILRWTGDVKESEVLRECRRLRSLGLCGQAVARLDSCLTRDHDAALAALELGMCDQEMGRLPSAEATFRLIADRDRLYSVWNPALAPALLHLGEVADLEGHRPEAVAWYRRAIEVPDESGATDRARQLAEVPYRAPVFPPPDSLHRYEGIYAIAGLGDYTVKVNEAGRLCMASPQSPGSGLEWLGGSRFGITIRDNFSIEFKSGPDGKVTGAVVRGPTIVLPAQRKEP
jgi:tetratricopeptide (TPR) repeat protein